MDSLPVKVVAPMTRLSAQQRKDALTDVIRLAEEALSIWANNPKFDESRFRDSVTSLYHARLIAENYDA